VEQALNRFPWAALFVRPWLQNFQHERGVPVPPEQELSAGEIDTIFTGGDAYTVVTAGRLAIRRGDRELCQRAYQRLLPLEYQCSHWGLMGMVWGGPVALELARFARYIGEVEQVARYLATAKTLARQMRAQPVLRAITEFDQRAATSEHTPAVHGGISLVQQGELWQVEYGAGRAVLKDSRGLQLLSKLLQQADREIHVLELVDGARREESDSHSDAPVDARRYLESTVATGTFCRYRPW